MTRRHVSVLVAAVLTAAAGLVGLSTAPATAAVCSGKGVNVVVDFGALPGGVAKSCDPSGAGKASRGVFARAGFKLVDNPREPGFVCQIDAKPADGKCSGTSSYWGLFWSDGTSGKWSYAAEGVDALKVPEGGFVAFAWQNSGSQNPPDTAPVNKVPTPKPTKKPEPKPTPQPTKKPQPKPTQAPGVTATAAPSAKTSAPAASTGPTKAPRASSSPTSSASATAAAASAEASQTPEDETSPEAAAVEKADSSFTPEDEGGGLPPWVPVAAIIVLAGSAGGALWWRRRTGSA